MEIRNATELDKEEFSQLYQKLYSPEGTKPPPQDSLPIENPAFFNLPMVAVEQDTIVGFIWGYVVDFGLKRYGYVEDLYVDEGWRT
ncbi:MAG: N-acetyltransferase [Promethearchaeota archaeon]|nr:MAG: N-acetyltransferase [Candidatus Lokiarchaeota archaeon]